MSWRMKGLTKGMLMMASRYVQVLRNMAPCGSESARLLEQQLNQKESHLHFLETVLQTN